MKKLFIMLVFGILSMSTLLAQELTFDDIKIVAKILDDSCPLMADDETRWDHFDAMEDNNGIVVQYTYTLINRIATDFSDTEMILLKVLQEKKLIKSLQENPSMAIIMENNITVTFVYYDKNHSLFMLFKITPEKYKIPIVPIVSGDRV